MANKGIEVAVTVFGFFATYFAVKNVIDALRNEPSEEFKLLQAINQKLDKLEKSPQSVAGLSYDDL